MFLCMSGAGSCLRTGMKAGRFRVQVHLMCSVAKVAIACTDAGSSAESAIGCKCNFECSHSYRCRCDWFSPAQHQSTL